MDYEQARRTMVDRQIRTADVTDRAILTAIGEVPRELFAPPERRPVAYSDADLPITKAKPGETPRYLVEPTILARLAQLAEVGSDDIVLDVGCGTGYSSAFLSLLANSVVALESDPDLAVGATETLLDMDIGNVAVVTGPLEAGYPSEGPYDVILMAGSVEDVPEALLSQLKDGGRLVTIVGVGPAGMATIFTHVDGAVSGRPAFNAPAPPLPGFAKPKTFQF